ncbi:MAG TPA: Ig-like domain-containing protein [Armatimonadota bacterium]|nr:Ig-like domain-containing protein [Armatimonadota bacterium]
MKMSRACFVVAMALAALAAWQPILVAQVAPELPPHVIDCSPAPFATNVDADLAELSVTFDRPMVPDAGFMGIRFLGVSPMVRGATPVWDGTGTVCTIAIELQDDVSYCMGLNTAKQRGKFMDTSGTPALSHAWVFSTGERGDADWPPHVTECNPAFGAMDADFRLREIEFTFSRPIAPGDFSCVLQRGAGEYPASQEAGELRLSEDRMTGILPVRLSPGTTYALEINDLSYCGWKDTLSRPVIPYGWCFRTAD